LHELLRRLVLGPRERRDLGELRLDERFGSDANVLEELVDELSDLAD
jgi:hypothetical protein